MDKNNNSYRYIHTIIVAFLSGIFVLAWLFVYQYLTKLVWQNDFVLNNRWMFPVIAISFSMIVGIFVRYFKAPTCINGGALEALKGGGEIDWKTLPSAVITSLASLLSGAVVGPEGAIGSLATDIAGWYNEKFKIKKEFKDNTIYASLASAYNGLIENPLFTAVLGNDLGGSKSSLPSNLIAGVIGYFIFLVAGGAGLENYFKLQQLDKLEPIYLIYILLFALVGFVLAVILGILFKVTGKIFSKLDNKILLRSLIAGIIIGGVGYFFPVIMFSGEEQILTVVADPLKYGIITLLAMALFKLILLSVSFKSGFLGGPIFPAIFSAVCVSLAINILFPQIPIILIIAGVMSGLTMMLFKAPFMVILLVAVFLGANTQLIGLIIMAVALILIIIPPFEKVMAKRMKN